MAVGYDGKLKIKNQNAKGPETTGAFLIRNSWGKEWGVEGYGWLPYEYLLQGLDKGLLDPRSDLQNRKSFKLTLRIFNREMRALN
jgi:C1A family cysteine protease